MKDEDIVLPELSDEPWGFGKAAMRKYAREAVRLNLAKLSAPVSGPLPFDLEKAKAGHPLVTRDGRKAEFIGYAEKADKGNRLICLIEGQDRCTAFVDDGKFLHGHTDHKDLFLAPPKMRTVWLSVWWNGFELESKIFESEAKANDSVVFGVQHLTAHPVQIPCKD